MFKDGAELEFNDKHVVIKGFGGRSKVNYRFTEPSMIVVAPEKGPTLPSVDVKFTLTENDYNWIIKSANILNSPNVGIVSDGNDVCVSIFDENDDSAHTNSVVLPNVETNGKKFKFVFKTMYLKFIPGDYVVEIYLKDSMGAAKFVENKLNLRYFTAIEKSSWIDS
jgi:hypothetical protein